MSDSPYRVPLDGLGDGPKRNDGLTPLAETVPTHGHAHAHGHEHGHEHVSAEPISHFHLNVREVAEDIAAIEFAPLGQRPLILLVPGIDEEGHRVLTIDSTSFTPLEAFELVRAAADALGTGIDQGVFDPREAGL